MADPAADAYAAGQYGLVRWQGPDPLVLLYAAAGIAAALLFSAAALPLLGAATRHDAVRYE
ncbi:MAG: hypothetical protein ABW022_19740 [Actinoplanes sp.]